MKIYFYTSEKSFTKIPNKIDSRLFFIKNKYEIDQVYHDEYKNFTPIFERKEIKKMLSEIKKREKIIFYSINEISIFRDETLKLIDEIFSKGGEILSFFEDITSLEKLKLIVSLDRRNRDTLLEKQIVPKSKKIYCFNCHSPTYESNITQCVHCAMIFCVKCVIFRDHKTLEGRCKN